MAYGSINVPGLDKFDLLEAGEKAIPENSDFLLGVEGEEFIWVPADAVGGGKREDIIIIGTSTAGWTEKDCDYLCDGIADDVEIRSAYYKISENSRTSGTIFLLPGTYNLVCPIEIYDHEIALIGSGSTETILSMDTFQTFASYSSYKGLLRTFGKAGGFTLKYPYKLDTDNAYAAVLENNSLTFDIDVNPTGGTGSYYAHGIWISGISNDVAYNCNFREAKIGSKIKIFESNLDSANVTGSYVDIVGCNLLSTNITGHHVNISGCLYISGRGFNPVIVKDTYAVSITGCVIGAEAGAIKISNSSDCSVSNNIITPNLAPEIENSTTVGLGIALYDSTRISVCGNTIYNKYGGIYIYNSSMCNISANTITRGTGLTSDYTSDQYTIDITGTGSTKNLVANNLIMGKNYTNSSGSTNTFYNNKYN